MKETILPHLRTKGQAMAITKERYQGMTNSIILSMVKKRLDTTFTSLVPSRFVKNLGYQYIKEMKIIFQSLKVFRN